MPAPTLQSMAARSCVRSLPSITDIAETPYELIRPVLKKIQNPQQLHEIEKNSPHIADADAELWRAFIARDIPEWESKIIEPKNPRSWWKVYRKLIREEEAKKEEQEAKLAAAMSGLSKEREANRAQFVGKVIPQHGSNRGKAFIDGVPNPNASSWGIVRGPPTLQNAKRGKDALAAIRKQSSQAAKSRDLTSRTVQFGRDMPAGGKSQVQSAPEWMVREQRRPAPVARVVAPAVGTAGGGRGDVPKVFAPRKAPTVTDRALDNAIRNTNAEREARLRALTGAKPKVAGAGVPPVTSAQPSANAVSQPPPRAVPRPTAVSPERVASPNPAAAALLAKKRPASNAAMFMPAKKVKR